MVFPQNSTPFLGTFFEKKKKKKKKTSFSLLCLIKLEINKVSISCQSSGAQESQTFPVEM